MVGMWATPSMAQCHLGLQAGASMANTSLGVTGSPFSIDGLGGQSSRPDLGIHVGCDLKVANSPFVIGAFGEWNSQEVSFEIQPSILKASVGNSWTVGGRLGYQMANGAMPYILGGRTQAEANFSSGLGPIPGGILPSHFQGWMYGAGIEMPIKGTQLSFALEARMIKYQSENILGAVDLQTDHGQVMGRLNWNFGAPPTSVLPLK